MEKEKKISRGIVIGCLTLVLALTIWVININDTYSTDSSTTPRCKTINGIEYKYLTNAENNYYGCCPVSDTAQIGMIIGLLEVNDRCYSTPINGICDAGYTFLNENYCVAKVGEIDNSVAQNYEVFFNTYEGMLKLNGSVQGRHVFTLSKLDYSLYTAEKEGYTFKGWDSSSSCASPKTSGTVNVNSKMTVYACYDANSMYEVTFNVGDGLLYLNGLVQSKRVFTLSKLDYSLYTAEKNTAEKEGYTFKGWDSSSSCTSPKTSGTVNVNSKMTVYACYDENKTSTTTTYSAKFNPNGGKFNDGTTSIKTIKYTDKKYFTDNDIVVTKEGNTFVGWQNTSGDIFIKYIDKSDNGSTLKAIWKSNSSSGNDTTLTPNPDIGDETKCEFVYKDSCEIVNDGYNCVKDENNCYVKGTKKQDDEIECTYNSKDNCESAYSGYNCIQDSNGCFIKGDEISNTSSDNDLYEPESNPNIGNSLLYLSILIGIITFGYTIYYINKIRKNEGN